MGIAKTINILPTCSACSLSAELARLRRENLELRQQAGYWKSQHARAVEQKTALQAQIEKLQAEIKQLKQQRFGRKSEKSADPKIGLVETADSPAPKRSRGQQKGGKGHGRRDYSHLPAVEEIRDVPPDKRTCGICGRLFHPLNATEDSQQIEIEVRAYRRIIRRQKYVPGCECPNPRQSRIVTAPSAPKIIPKSPYGISIWVMILLDKFQSMRPTTRLLAQLELHGLGMPIGTITDGLKTLAPLFEPIHEKLVERSRTERHWHADETRWLVFAEVEGKTGHRWYLWVFASESAVVYVLDQTRSKRVPVAHFGVASKGILSVDRYSAYKALAKEGVELVLAFCWAHVRRDFVDALRGWPDQQEWAQSWVADIAQLYHLNDRRLEVRDQSQWPARQAELKQAIDRMAVRCEQEAAQKPLHPALRRAQDNARRKVLTSLKAHWEGLTVFVDHPDVPMDNNAAERLLRQPVVGRKNFYGSAAKWSGNLLAWMLSIFQTLTRWEVNLLVWLTAYLQACAENGGHAPADISAFLPWNFKPAPVQAAPPNLPVSPADTS